MPVFSHGFSTSRDLAMLEVASPLPLLRNHWKAQMVCHIAAILNTKQMDYMADMDIGRERGLVVPILFCNFLGGFNMDFLALW